MSEEEVFQIRISVNQLNNRGGGCFISAEQEEPMWSEQSEWMNIVVV